MNQKGFATIALIVLVIIAASVLGYVTLVKKSAPTEQPQSNNAQNTQPATPSTPAAPPSSQQSTSQTPSAEIASWKTHTNTEYGFEFRYPDGLALIAPRNECWYGKEIVRLQGISNTLCVAFDLSRSDPKSLKFPEDIFGKVVPENISVSSRQGSQYSFGGGTTGQRLVTVKLNNGLLIIDFVQGTLEVSSPSLDFFQNNLLLMNQILSTFKFTR